MWCKYLDRQCDKPPRDSAPRDGLSRINSFEVANASHPTKAFEVKLGALRGAVDGASLNCLEDSALLDAEVADVEDVVSDHGLIMPRQTEITV